MRRAPFLPKLAREGMLRLDEPNPDLARAYLARSEESMISAKALLRIGSLRDSVALAYYAMYHASLALLHRIGIKCENHAATIILLHDLFGLDNAAISKAKKERIDKQYDVDFDVTKAETEQAIRTAEGFAALLSDHLAKLTEARVEELRSVTRRLLRA